MEIVTKYVSFSTLVLIGSTSVFALIADYIVKKAIDFLTRTLKSRHDDTRSGSKTQTVRHLLKSIATGVIYFIALLIVLARLGVNILPLLTGAGILGLAFSFGSQSLVKDLISGFFITIENQYNIGEKIQVGDKSGEVIDFTLRATVLKDQKDNIIFIPNSQILIVTRLKKEIPKKN